MTSCKYVNLPVQLRESLEWSVPCWLRCSPESRYLSRRRSCSNIASRTKRTVLLFAN